MSNGNGKSINYEGLMEGLDETKQKVVQSLLSTISLQAEVIRDLLWDVDLEEGARSHREKILSGISLTILAAKLKEPAISGPTLKEVNDAIGEMQNEIKSMNNANDIFGSILGFGLKIAPLLL